MTAEFFTLIFGFITVLLALLGVIVMLIQSFSSVRTEINQVRTELKSEINELRTEVKSEIYQLRTEVKSDINKIDVKLDTLLMALFKKEIEKKDVA